MQAPTISSPEYIFFGKLEVELQVAPGAGIVTSIVLQSDTLDEIDWVSSHQTLRRASTYLELRRETGANRNQQEWLGGSPNEVQTNYFSKGDTSTYDRGGHHPVDDAIGGFHTYTIDWTKDSLTWSIDGNVVRVLTYEDAKGGTIYPQSPMQVKLGSWVAGRSDAPEGTVQWAGGLANFDNGPSVAYYKRVSVVDYQGGEKGAKAYIYSDRSGTWESIYIDTDGSGLQDKELDDEDDDKSKTKTKSDEDDAEETGSSNSTSVSPTASSTPTTDSSSTENEAAETEPSDSGALALHGMTFAGVILSGVAVFANLI